MAEQVIEEIRVYWDNTAEPEGWAYRLRRLGRPTEQGLIDGVADNNLDGAIDEACRVIGVDLRADQFAREPNVDGGFAIWAHGGDPDFFRRLEK